MISPTLPQLLLVCMGNREEYTQSHLKDSSSVGVIISVARVPWTPRYRINQQMYTQTQCVWQDGPSWPLLTILVQVISMVHNSVCLDGNIHI